VRRVRLHRPSAATIISLVALFFAMGGTAVAATGGNFILGNANTATSVSSLANTAGTALSLSSTSTTPPLTVSNSVRVPKLNASELGGHTAGAFLLTTGTAANSSALGGIPASGFIQGGGAISDARLTLPLASGSHNLLSASGSVISAACPSGNAGDQLTLSGTSASDVTATWWSKDAISQDTTINDTVQVGLNGSPTLEGTDLIVVQVDAGSSISTYTLTESYNSGTSTCLFTGQVVTSNG
jgi:hypothetical protein